MNEHNKNFYSLEELQRTRDSYEGYLDGEEVYYFVGAIRYACDEIERLNNQLEEKEAILGGIQQLEAEIERLNKEIVHYQSGKYFVEMLNEKNRLNNIRNEAIKCINYYAIEDEDYSKIYNQEEQELLEILRGDKE